MYLHVVRTKERIVEYGELCWVPKQVALMDSRGMCGDTYTPFCNAHVPGEAGCPPTPEEE